MFFLTQHVIVSAADAPIQTLPSLAAWWAALVEDLLELLQVFDKTGRGLGNLTSVRQDRNRNRKALCDLKLSLVLLKRSIVV